MQISTPCSMASLVEIAPSGAAHVIDRHVGAFLAQADGDRLADARAPAGDDSHLVLQSSHDVLLMGMVAGRSALPIMAVMHVLSHAGAPALRDPRDCGRGYRIGHP
jgi:hypothetical protein